MFSQMVLSIIKHPSAVHHTPLSISDVFGLAKSISAALSYHSTVS